MTRLVAARLAALKRGRSAAAGWLLREPSATICAVTEEGLITPVITAPREQLTEAGLPSEQWWEYATYIVEALNAMPVLIDALERVLVVVDGLEDMAEKREHAAHWARIEGRYDVSQVHRQSARRVRTTRQAVMEVLYAAFRLPSQSKKSTSASWGRQTSMKGPVNESAAAEPERDKREP